jgi:hypothetical protein
MGEVTRVFQRSAYFVAGRDYVLILWGGPRSPMTVNIEEFRDPQWRIKVGEHCFLSREQIGFEVGKIDVRRAKVFRSPLLDKRRITLLGGSRLAKGVAMLRSLYEVSPSGPTLADDPALRSFVREALHPYTIGSAGPVHCSASYRGLIGRGGGFTPAGDDFVGGFLATYNYVARCRKGRQVRIPSALIRGKTVPESGMILVQAAKGNVDEGIGGLIIAATGGSGRFYDELMAVARRGHTSGIDMSLGVLLCGAAIGEADGERGLLQMCLDALWKP